MPRSPHPCTHTHICLKPRYIQTRMYIHMYMCIYKNTFILIYGCIYLGEDR